jgi:hypothetical protein
VRGGNVAIKVSGDDLGAGSYKTAPGEGFHFKVNTSLPKFMSGEQAARHIDVIPMGLPLPLGVSYRVQQGTGDVLIKLGYQITKLN